MVNRDNTCKACDGIGLLADDEGWQYTCSVCHGEGTVDQKTAKASKIMSVDENNRLID